MDHQSGQGFNSDDSDLDMQAEISEKHKKVDEFSKNLELCGSEDEMFVEIEQPLANISTDIEAVEPFIGMEFNSREEAREFYIAYGRRVGFTVRIHHNRRSRVNNQDEKDKRIRELSLELYNERQKCKRRCAAYEEQLNMILNDLEKHTEHISEKVAAVVRSIREIEEEISDSDGG
ncbi:hypothetical protein JHK84_038517 [Glycine max]|nr:hypothetical protein JHK84_038517 [Glycine max]